MPSSPRGRTSLWRPVSAPVVNAATQVEFSPRNLPRDQSLLSYDSDNSIATDPGYATVRRPRRVVEQAEVVVEPSPAERVSSLEEMAFGILDRVYCAHLYVDLDM